MKKTVAIILVPPKQEKQQMQQGLQVALIKGLWTQRPKIKLRLEGYLKKHQASVFYPKKKKNCLLCGLGKKDKPSLGKEEENLHFVWNLEISVKLLLRKFE